MRVHRLWPLLLALAVPGTAQEPEGRECPQSAIIERHDLTGVAAEYQRLLELTGDVPPRSGLLRRPGEARHVCPTGAAGGAWARRLMASADAGGLLTPAPVTARLYSLSAYPADRNNGALWTGRGVSTRVSGGVHLGWGALSAALVPEASYQANRAFDLHYPKPNRAWASEFAYPWHFHRIDLPTRFGEEPFWTLHPGQSFVRADVGPVAGGVSTENLWWGPGRHGSILLSNTAPGFTHVFLGTSGPVDVGIGKLETELVWGGLGESDHYDSNPDNDRRLFTGLVASLQPRGAPGLFLGYARVHVQAVPPEGLDFEDYVPFLETPWTLDIPADDNPYGNEMAFAMTALYVRGVLPESGFEVYLEWARNEAPEDLDDFLAEPGHSQAYALGFQKLFEGEATAVRLAGELMHLNQHLAPEHRFRPTYYRHDLVLQGYTHEGQALGAWIGPGSDAQYLEIDLLTEWGLAGAFVERVRHDTDAYFYEHNKVRGYWPWLHDTELGLGVRGAYMIRGVTLDGRLTRTDRRSRNFTPDLRETNWMLEFGASWRP